MSAVAIAATTARPELPTSSGLVLLQMHASGAVWGEAASDVGTTRDVAALTGATVTQNNLGGLGPDTGEARIVYENVAVGGTGANQFSVNMVVTNTSTYTPNYPKAKNGNGMRGASGTST